MSDRLSQVQQLFFDHFKKASGSDCLVRLYNTIKKARVLRKTHFEEVMLLEFTVSTHR